MLSMFTRASSSPDKIMHKTREVMRDVVEYRMSGRVDASAYSNLKVLLDELVEVHKFDETLFEENICFEPEREIKCVDIIELMGPEIAREIVLPVRYYANFLVSYCREDIAKTLTEYALRFNRDEANTVTALRKLIHKKVLERAKELDERLPDINIIIRDENDELKIIKTDDEIVGKFIVKKMIENFDMFYIRKVYLENIGLIDRNEKNIRNSLFRLKFYNNSLYILRVLLNLNIKDFGDDAVDIGIANCCRISGVKLRGDINEVVASLDKFANRKGYLGLDFIDKVAADVSKFHDDIIKDKLDYDIIRETINLITENVKLELVREITACIAVLLLTKYKHGKLGALEKLCILDGILSKAL
ncbi:MAG: hypothetical protein ACRC41_10880 [Sarcina sp.]